MPNIIWFEDTTDSNCAGIDYAGLADKFLHSRTSVEGSFYERPRPDGWADLIVFLQTKGALTWVAQSCAFEGSMLFGYRVSEILEGEDTAEPVFGNSCMELHMINVRPGAPLFDIFQGVSLPNV